MKHEAHQNRARRIDALRLAAAAGCDPRTAAKAIEQGPTAVKGIVGDRLAEAMRSLGIPNPLTAAA